MILLCIHEPLTSGDLTLSVDASREHRSPAKPRAPQERRQVSPVWTHAQLRKHLAQSGFSWSVNTWFQCPIMGLASTSPENLTKYPVSLHNSHFCLSTRSVSLVVLSGTTKDSHPHQKHCPTL